MVIAALLLGPNLLKGYPCPKIDDSTILVRFMEDLSTFNGNLLIDRGDVLMSRGNSRTVNQLNADLQGERKLVLSLMDDDIAHVSSQRGSDEPWKQFMVALQGLAVGLEALDTTGKAHQLADLKKQGKAWGEYNLAFQKAVAAAVKSPGFSLANLSSPALYNLAPDLYEGREGMVLAEPRAPQSAKIGRTFGDTGLKLRKGDEIVALRGLDEKDWTAVKTWSDVLKIAREAEEDGEDDALKVMLRVKRRSAVLEIGAKFLKRRIEWE